MKKYFLDNDWKLKIVGKDEELTGADGIDAKVPGSVYSALLDNGKIEDPFYRDNELKVLPVMDNDFEFTTSFDVTEDMLKADKLLLRFDGIDTLADIFVNDKKIGFAENMHCFYEYDLLLDNVCVIGKNSLKVYIYSPTKYIKAENEKSYTGGARECMEGFPHIRKAHCMFGWDWGPRIPDAGIYRSVYIEEYYSARIESVYISQKHYWDPKDIAYSGTVDTPPSSVTLDFDIELNEYVKDDYKINIVVYSPNGDVHTQGEIDDLVVITEPEIWWPNGYGAQPLYRVEVTLFDKDMKLLDTWSKRIGLRTLTVNTEKDEWGECFAHEVNGVKIFAMGADYIPEDNILSRVSEERTRRLLEDAVWANHNCIRVWGGGYYLDDYFYDICDELGLIVWQDFMYACAAYDLTEEFEANIVNETTQIIRRLRHHACIGVWCGNNELETQVLDGAWGHTLKQKADYTKMFEYIIPKILKKECPEAFYWPSSPSSGGAWDNPWDDTRGDVHYWDVWHGEKPFTDYRNYNFRYLSEFGFQSFPCQKTVNEFALPEDQNIFSYVMEMHQRNVAANGKILKYISATYLYPKNFEMLLYASQLLQADAIRYGVEHFRRHRGQCMGAVVWQLNDIWPVASWASIDYFGRYKALHYAEKRMFNPVMISCEETGEVTERPFCILEPKEINVGARIHVANENKHPVYGRIEWKLRMPDSSVVDSGTINITVPALDGVWTDYMDFKQYDVHKIHLEYRFMQTLTEVSRNTVLFTPPKHYEFVDPKLTVERDGDKLIVNSEAYAKNVYIEGVDGDVWLSDNYFDMEKGSVTVKIERGNATEFKVVSVYDIK